MNTPGSSTPPSSVNPGRKTLVERVMSIDALRGFDMFWIIGAEDIVHALHKVSQTGPANLLATQLTHKDWAGLAFYDTIFPLFVFIVGVSIVFSLGKTIEQEGRAAAYRRVLTRGVLLYVIGILYYGGFSAGVEKIRLLGVLQRIALAYLFGGLIFCTFRWRGILACCAALLVGYWAMMTFIPVPGVGAGHFAEGANLANWVDKQYLPFRKWDGDHDPEGVLSTLPAIGSCLLGIFAGLVLRNKEVLPQRKVFWLVGGGMAAVVLGSLWALQFPVIKKLWTSSYVLVVGGYSAMILAAFYQMIDIWGWRKWAQPFVWIGTNALTIYLAHNIIDFPKLAERFAGGPIKASFGAYGELLITSIVLGLSFVLVRYLYRRKIFLRL